MKLLIYAYVLVVIINFVYYGFKTYKNYLTDLEDSKKDDYMPTDMVGDIIHRLFLIFVPFFNFAALVADIIPNVFPKAINKIFNIIEHPLVPPKK